MVSRWSIVQTFPLSSSTSNILAGKIRNASLKPCLWTGLRGLCIAIFCLIMALHCIVEIKCQLTNHIHLCHYHMLYARQTAWIFNSRSFKKINTRLSCCPNSTWIVTQEKQRSLCLNKSGHARVHKLILMEIQILHHKLKALVLEDTCQMRLKPWLFDMYPGRCCFRNIVVIVLRTKLQRFYHVTLQC